MKPKLKIISGDLVQVGKIESLTQALQELKEYKDPKLYVREDPYYKHLFKAFPSETVWIVIKPSEGWIFWNQVAYNALKYTEPEKLLPYMLGNYDPKSFLDLVKQLQPSPSASMRIVKVIGDFQGFAKTLLRDPGNPLQDYKIYLVDPTTHNTQEVTFIERDGYWMFLKAKRYT